MQDSRGGSYGTNSLRGHLALNSSPYKPCINKLSSQHLIQDQMSSHYYNLATIKSAIDNKPPKSTSLSIKKRDQLRRNALIKQLKSGTSSNQMMMNKKSRVHSTSSSFGGHDDKSIPSRPLTASSSWSPSNYNASRYPRPATASNFSYHKPSTANTSPRPLDNSQKNVLNLTYSGDYLDRHQERFENSENVDFKPRIKKTKTKSFLSQSKHYAPPTKKKDSVKEKNPDDYKKPKKEDLQQADDVDRSSDHRRWIEEQSKFVQKLTLIDQDETMISNRSRPSTSHSDTRRRIRQEEEDLRYYQFINEVTNDILSTGAYSDRILHQLMERHVERRKHELSVKKMWRMLDELKRDLDIDEKRDKKPPGNISYTSDRMDSSAYIARRLTSDDLTALRLKNESIRMESALVDSSGGYHPSQKQDDYDPTQKQDDNDPTRKQDDYDPTRKQDDYDPTRKQDDYDRFRKQDDHDRFRKQDDYDPTRKQDDYDRFRRQDDHDRFRKQDHANYRHTSVDTFERSSQHQRDPGRDHLQHASSNDSMFVRKTSQTVVRSSPGVPKKDFKKSVRLPSDSSDVMLARDTQGSNQHKSLSKSSKTSSRPKKPHPRPGDESAGKPGGNSRPSTPSHVKKSPRINKLSPKTEFRPKTSSSSSRRSTTPSRKVDKPLKSIVKRKHIRDVDDESDTGSKSSIVKETYESNDEGLFAATDDVSVETKKIVKSDERLHLDDNTSQPHKLVVESDEPTDEIEEKSTPSKELIREDANSSEPKRLLQIDDDVKSASTDSVFEKTSSVTDFKRESLSKDPDDGQLSGLQTLKPDQSEEESLRSYEPPKAKPRRRSSSNASNGKRYSLTRDQASSDQPQEVMRSSPPEANSSDVVVGSSEGVKSSSVDLNTVDLPPDNDESGSPLEGSSSKHEAIGGDETFIDKIVREALAAPDVQRGDSDESDYESVAALSMVIKPLDDTFRVDKKPESAGSNPALDNIPTNSPQTPLKDGSDVEEGIYSDDFNSASNVEDEDDDAF